MRHIWILIFAALILVGPALVPLFDPEVGIARADDDDGGDDGGDDDGDDDDDDDRDSPRRGERDAGPRTGEQGGGFLRRLFPRREAAAPRRRVAPPPPVAVPDEIVVLSLAGEDLAALEAQGFALIETRTLNTLQTTAHRLRIPEATSLNAARDLVRARPSAAGADLNHYYRREQGFDPDCNGLECPIRASFGWPIPDARAMSCGEGVRIGLVDTGLNPDHETFEGAALRVLDFKPLGDTASRALHGTAVAALLVGNPGTRSPGLLPQAEVVAIDPFHRAGGDERADVFSLMDAIDRIAQEDIDVMNLSLAGPPNAALAALLRDLIDSHNLVVVAAAGNAGPQSEPFRHPGGDRGDGGGPGPQCLQTRRAGTAYRPCGTRRCGLDGGFGARREVEDRNLLCGALRECGGSALAPGRARNDPTRDCRAAQGEGHRSGRGGRGQRLWLRPQPGDQPAVSGATGRSGLGRWP